MIKVLKEGAVIGNKVTCTRCGCVFEYEEEDIVKLNTTLTIQCPNASCQEIIVLSRDSRRETLNLDPKLNPVPKASWEEFTRKNPIAEEAPTLTGFTPSSSTESGKY